MNDGKILLWLQIADDEYITSRTLLRQGFVVQGAILSASAIEKYLKVVCLIHEVEFEKQGQKAHDLLILHSKLKNVYSSNNLNISFLELLNKTYKLRYPDSVSNGFNIALHQGKTLVGLDETVYKIRHRINFVGLEHKLRFDLLLEGNDENLLKGNHAFGKAKRNEAFITPLTWYEMRILKNGVRIESGYTSTAKDDGVYNLKGLQQGSNDRTFHTQEKHINITS